jgi:glycosyltransferase involved in cell wall biosynthesis/peptidoglycan/xylan/chitin deacetylase (PgdA/CDA1 family)
VFQLRLNRNCWDFTIVAPDTKVLDLPRVSVLIPAYEAASTICRAVESVLAQTWQSFEIIVVDDGSRDETSAALATYQFDGRLRVLQDGTNRGQSRALNWALEIARGEIVVQLDADDWLERDALASIVACFDRRPGTGAVFADARAHEPSGIFVASGPSLRSPADCLTYSAVQAPRAYRADLIRQIGGWSVNDEHEGRLFEDRVTLARICAAAPVRHIRRVLYNFDARPNSLHRREPWRTNKAKYLILTAAANQLRCELRVTEGPRPRYALVPKGERRRRRGWSIVIPAHDRPDLLRIALTSWLQSDACDGEAAEIIVVDDGTPNRLESTVNLHHPRLRFVRHDRRRGPAAARNTGAAEAKFEMLFFSDGDHVVPPDVLGEHEHRHDSLAIDALVVGGLYGRKVATVLEPSRLESRTIARLMELSRFDRQRMEAIAAATAFGGTVDLCPSIGGELFARLHTQSFSDTYLSAWFDYLSPWSVEEPEALRFLRLRTGNLSLPVPLFRLLGGFDAALGEMEDWELGIRALAAGVAIEFAPHAEPLHQLHPPNDGATETLHASWQILRDKHPAAMSQLSSALGRASPPGSSVIRSLLRALPDVRSPRSNPKLMATPEVALTFDDGPHPVGTPPMLQILREAGAQATFFLLSTNCQRYAHIVREIVESGCEVGVHGRTHDSVVGHPTEDVLEELFRATEEISDIAGVRPRFCRPPYGLGSQAYFEAAQMLGLQPVGWDVSLGDWRPSPQPELLTRLALASVIGKVVLLHDATGDLSGTSQAVRWLLTAGASAGLKGRTLTEFSKRSNLPPLEPPAG